MPTEKELKAQLIQMEVERREKRNEQIIKARQLLFDQVDLFLQLLTDHDCTSCSDDNPQNGYAHNSVPRCRRCALIRMKKDGYNDDFHVDVTLLNAELQDTNPKNITVQLTG